MIIEAGTRMYALVIDSVCLFGRLHVFHFLPGEKVFVLEGVV